MHIKCHYSSELLGRVKAHKFICKLIYQFSSVQSLSPVQLSGTPWTVARQASLSITKYRRLLKLMSIESVMSSNHLILCRPLLLPPSTFPASGSFQMSALQIRWPKYWRFSFSISPSNEYPGLISFGMDWLDLLVVQGTLKSLLQHHSSKASLSVPSPPTTSTLLSASGYAYSGCAVKWNHLVPCSFLSPSVMLLRFIYDSASAVYSSLFLNMISCTDGPRGTHPCIMWWARGLSPTWGIGGTRCCEHSSASLCGRVSVSLGGYAGTTQLGSDEH